MDINSLLIEAIHGKRLAQVAAELLASRVTDLGEHETSVIRAANSVCSNIRDLVLHERNAVSRRLLDANIPHTFDEDELAAPQIHQFSITVDQEDPGRAVALLEKQGYFQPVRLSGIQWQILRRTRSQMVMTRRDDVTMRLRLRWHREVPEGVVASLWPTIDDGALVPLGAKFWWLAFVARPLGIALRRFGNAKRREDIGEFLGTPEELVPALLEFAGVSGDDVIYDLGCGDGRVLVNAAKRYACRTVGYELDAALCERARHRAKSQNVSDLVEIRNDDVMKAEIDDATVVFLFLPPQTVSRLLPRLLETLPAGSRVIAHEQSPFETDLPPQESRPLFRSYSLTVASKWKVQ